MNIKKPIIATAALAVVSLAAIGSVTAAHATTNNGSSNGTSIVDKIASKFNLNVADVKAVFDKDHAAHEAQEKTDQANRLAAAVTAGTITQAQADHIKSALAEIDTLRGTTSPEDESTTVRDQIKTKMDALRTWASDNKIDMGLVGHGGHHGGFGGPRGDKTADTATNTAE